MNPTPHPAISCTETGRLGAAPTCRNDAWARGIAGWALRSPGSRATLRRKLCTSARTPLNGGVLPTRHGGLCGTPPPDATPVALQFARGECFPAHHAPLRGIGAGALPGKSLVIYEPELEMATDVVPCEDGHAQERSLLSAVLPTVVPYDLMIMDRNFCVRDFLHGIFARGAYFICRQHQGLPWQADGDEPFVGRSEIGALFEQEILVSDSGGNPRCIRRIRILLKQATRDGDKELTLLTNRPASAGPSKPPSRNWRRTCIPKSTPWAILKRRYSDSASHCSPTMSWLW